jgi:hypothetical protein
MRVVIPESITDDELIGWIKGYFAPSGVLGDIGDRLDVGRGDQNNFPYYHGFALIVPEGGISLDEIVECTRSSFLRPKGKTLVERGREWRKKSDSWNEDENNLINDLVDELERLQEFERLRLAEDRSRILSDEYRRPFGGSR